MSNEESSLFRERAEIHIAADADDVYRTVSDLPRSKEWSVECTGGEWISGRPGTPGAVFRGQNVRSEDVVAWAPVVRGAWTTEAEVVTADPPRSFQWSMRDASGTPQESVWGFDVHPEDGGCRLVHHFRMGAPTEGIRGITADMDESQRNRFFAEWSEKLRGDLAATVERIKDVVEAR